MSTNDIAKQAAISTLKGAIAAIPFVGGVINEYAFEARGRIKQERVNSFIHEFAEYLTQFKPVQLDIEQIKKEEFGDYFEEVIISVSKNHSKIKKDAFKHLLANQLLKPKGINYAELLLSTIDGLHEKQIPILNKLNDSSSSSYIDFKGELIQDKRELSRIEKKLKAEYGQLDSVEDAMYVDEIQNLKKEKKEVQEKILNLESKVEKFKEPFVSETYEIPNHEFYFLIQDLCNKGLLIDTGMKYGAEPYELFEISQLGIDLVEAIVTQ